MDDKPANGGQPQSEVPGDRLRRECADYQARRQLAPLLRGTVLAPDIRAKLAEADRAGCPAGAEVAVQLHRLRDLQLGPEKSGTVIRAAANRVVELYIARRERGGRLTTELLNAIDVADVPAKTFAREFAVALANQVTWVAKDMHGERGDGSGSPRQATVSARRDGCSTSARQRDIETLRRSGTWGIPGTRACNADLADICDDFRNVPVNRIRQVLIDKSSGTGQGLYLTEVLKSTRQTIQDELNRATSDRAGA